MWLIFLLMRATVNVIIRRFFSLGMVSGVKGRPRVTMSRMLKKLRKSPWENFRCDTGTRSEAKFGCWPFPARVGEGVAFGLARASNHPLAGLQ